MKEERGMWEGREEQIQRIYMDGRDQRRDIPGS